MAKRGRGGRGVRAAEPALPSVAGHPRARAQVARAKAWGGLVGFALVALLSLRAGVPTADVLMRALAGGVVAYLATWACAVALWRQFVLTELRMAREQRAAALAEAAGATDPTGAAAPGAR